MPDTILAFNRELAKELGISAALLFQELQRKHHYWKAEGKLNEDGEFWCDQKDIAEWILLHPNNVGVAAKKLEEAGLIIKRTGYRPNSTTPTTWWKVVISEINETVISRNQRNSDFYIKANTKADTEKKSQNENETTRMMPSTLYTKLRNVFPGSKNDLRKKKIEAVRRLQEEFELSDETIIDGVSEIAKHPVYKFSDGNEFTETLTSLLLARDLDKTAEKIVKKAEAKQVKDKADEKNTFVYQGKKYKTIPGGICY